MDTKIRSPVTGRWIKIGGSMYHKLIKEGRLLKKEVENAIKKVVRGFQPPAHYRVTKKLYPEYGVDRSDVPWGEKKPERKKERQHIMAQCGESCFLLPDTLKFPICNKTLPCQYNCRGLKAASSRAGEWGYDKVLPVSKKVTQILGCYKS